MKPARAPLLLVALAPLVVGCAYRTPATRVPAALSTAVPATVAPIDVSVSDASGALDAPTAAAVREQAARLLAEAARSGVPGADARVHVHVELLERRDASDSLRQDGFAIFGLWPVVFGMVCERQKLAVDVEVESGGRTLEGHGTADKLGGIYAPARRRALAVALNEALADAARSGEP